MAALQKDDAGALLIDWKNNIFRIAKMTLPRKPGAFNLDNRRIERAVDIGIREIGFFRTGLSTVSYEF